MKQIEKKNDENPDVSMILWVWMMPRDRFFEPDPILRVLAPENVRNHQKYRKHIKHITKNVVENLPKFQQILSEISYNKNLPVVKTGKIKNALARICGLCSMRGLCADWVGGLGRAILAVKINESVVFASFLVVFTSFY